MKLFRITDPGHVDLMAHKLLTADGTPAAAIAAELKAWLRDNPDDILIIQAWDKHALAGFVICMAEAGKSHAWLWQAYSAPTTPKAIVAEAFAHVCKWSRDKGRSQIRAESWRGAEGLQRSWGWRPIHTIVGVDLTEGTSKPT